MPAFDVTLVQQITFILGRRDPAGIFEGNPDAPPDEYEGEAEEILEKLSSLSGSKEETFEVVRQVFRDSCGDEEIELEAVSMAAKDIHQVRSGIR